VAKAVKVRAFGGAPAVDFLDLSYLMPMLAAAALNDSPTHPLKYGAPIKLGGALAQSFGKLPRWQFYERFARHMMTEPHEAETVKSWLFARWAANLYRGRKYQFVVIGPPLGSLVYLSMILDAPFLPLNYGLAIRHKPINPDNMAEHIEIAKKWAAHFAKTDPDIHIVHEYNPVHQRFRLKHGSLLRCRFTAIPEAYDDFIAKNLAPNGTVIIVESRIGWRQYKLAGNLSHQVGQPGGIPCEEYLFSSPRLDKFRSRFMQTEACYRLNMPDEIQPESRFGVTPRMRLSVISSADEHRKNVCQLYSDEIYLVNQLVSQLFLRGARRDGALPSRCYVHSGNFIAPQPCMHSNLLPVWSPTPCYPAFQFVETYLKKYPHKLEEILVSFEPSMEEAPDFIMLERWKEMLEEKAPVRFVGMNPSKYPREATSVFRQWNEIVRWSKRHKHPLKTPITIDTIVQEAEKSGIYFQVTENK